MSKVDSLNKVLYLDNADFSLKGSDNYQWFGFDATCTKEKQLIVSSPGKRTPSNLQAAGAVYVYSTHDKSLIYKLESTEDQSKFGTSISYNSEKHLLAVGAPSRSDGSAYHAGAVYIYDLNSGNVTFENHQSMLYSYDRAARFGKTVLWAGSENLVVGAPSYTSYNTLSTPNEQGKVFWFRGANALSGQYSTLWASQTFETQEPGCRHGDTLRYIPAPNNQLLVGSPMCHNLDKEGKEARIAGRVFMFQEASRMEEALFLA